MTPACVLVEGIQALPSLPEAAPRLTLESLDQLIEAKKEEILRLGEVSSTS